MARGEARAASDKESIPSGSLVCPTRHRALSVGWLGQGKIQGGGKVNTLMEGCAKRPKKCSTLGSINNF